MNHTQFYQSPIPSAKSAFPKMTIGNGGIIGRHFKASAMDLNPSTFFGDDTAYANALPPKLDIFLKVSNEALPAKLS